MELSENALDVLRFRYLQEKPDGSTETPEELFARVATSVASVEEPEDREAWSKMFLDMFLALDFLPNTPALINAGRPIGQLIACYVVPITDSIEGIFDAIKEAAIIHKSGGGTGFDFSELRPAGYCVQETGGIASGPVSFLRVFDAATGEMKQGGVRRGASMGILRCDHPDIFEFVASKKVEGSLSNFNISVAITSEFMRCLESGSPFHLRWNSKVVREIQPASLWDAIVERCWSNGEPGLVFIDEINNLSVLSAIETIKATNPCSEEPLPAYGACSLGSINLSNFVHGGKVNYNRLRRVVHAGVRFLDDIVDATKYPLKQIEVESKKTRRIGLGIMGLADMLLKLEINYNSVEALSLASTVMDFVHEESIKASEELGEFRGVPDALSSIGIDRRNGMTTTIAPTGSLSLIAGCSSGCEPVFSFHYKKQCIDSVLDVIHPLAQKYLSSGSQLPDYFVTARDVLIEQHIKMQSALQEYVHAGISKTINAPECTTVEQVSEALLLCYKLGCKSVAFYREGSRSIEAHVAQDKPGSISTTPLKRPGRLYGVTERIETPRGRLYVTVNDVDGLPFEVFLKIGKSGAEDFAYSEAIGRLISLSLRSGVLVGQVIQHLKNISGASQIWVDGTPVKSVPDAVGRVLESLYNVDSKDEDKVLLGDCPVCSGVLTAQEGCFSCLSCGWSKC